MSRRAKVSVVALSLLMGVSVLSFLNWGVRAKGESRSLVERVSRHFNWIGGATSPAALVPTVTATKADSLLTDVNGNGQADPGDTLKYTVTIGASGMDAMGVMFSDTLDANTMLVNGSVMTTPLAIADNYTASGNVQITIAAPGVLANDADPDNVGPALTINAGAGASANGGNVTLNSDGGFTYNPPPGFEGTDTFTYTLNDNEGNTDTATVTFTVSGMIWFVNSSAGGGGDGRLTSPFNALASVTADDPGDNIFLFSGGYTGGRTLKANQKLIGQGATATLSSISGVTPPAGSLSLPATGGARPTVSSSGSNITLSTDNLIRGLDLANTGGTALTGSGFGALTVSEVSVSNTNGIAINLDTGAPTASFTSVSSSGGANGIILQNTTGSFTVTGSGGSCTPGAPTCTGGTISNTTGADVPLTNVTPPGTGIVLNNVTNVSLSRMRIRDHSNFGIRGNSVNGFALSDSVVDAPSGFNGDNDAFEESSIFFQDLVGACSITNCDISDGNEDNMRVDNTSSSALNLTVTGSNFHDNRQNLGGNAGLHLNARSSGAQGAIVANITNTTFHNLRGDGILGRGLNDGLIDITASGCVFTESDQALDLAVSQNADLNYAILNNLTMTGHTQGVIQVVIGEVSSLSSVSGRITGNVIGNAAVDSGSVSGFGLNLDLRGNGSSATTIHGNTISHTDREGILLFVRGVGSSVQTGMHQMRITDNIINAPDDNSAFPFGDINGIEIETNNGQTFCLNMSGNNSSPAAPGALQRDGYRLRQRNQGAASVFQIQGLTPASGATAAQVEAYIESINTGPCFVVPASGTTIVAYTAATCGGTPAPLMGPFNETLSFAVRSVSKQAEQEPSARTLGSFVRRDGTLLAAYGEGPGRGVVSLNEAQLRHYAQEAKARLLAAGVSAEDLALLERLRFEVADLPEDVLATASSRVITLDENAAGHGWFIDPTPYDDREFPLGGGHELRANPSDPLLRQMDLLTAVMREMAHVLGQEKQWRFNELDGLMTRTLPAGVRRAPEVTETEDGKLIGMSEQIRLGGTSMVERAGAKLGFSESFGKTAATGSSNAALAQQMRPIYSAFPSPAAYTRPDLRRETMSGPAAAPMVAIDTVNLNIGTLPAGKSIVITFNATINNTLTPATTAQVCNQGTVSGSNFASLLTNDPDTPAPNDPTCTTLTNADLSVTKSAGASAVCEGGAITYTINFGNGGPNTAQTVTVSDATPANTTFVSAAAVSGAGWSVAAPSPGGTGAITFSKPSVANAETAVFEIVVNVNSGVANNTVINNTTTAASTTIDPNLANNTGSASVTAKQTPTATAGPDQTIVPNGATAPLGGNTPPSGATGTWSVVIGGAGTFNPNANDPNATFTHTGGAGPITLRWTVSNPPCATASEDVIITVGTPPTISCPSNITVSNTPGQCSALVPFSVTSTGVPTPTVVCKIGSTVITSPHTFPLGVTTVNCTAANGIAPDAACSFTVTVNDTEAPAITACASNKTLSTNGAAQIALPDFTGEIVASDTCSTVTVTQAPAPGTMIGLGNTTVTFTVKDAANNTATCSAVVTVVKFGISGFVVFSQEHTFLRSNTEVITGNVGANTSLPDPNGGADDKEEVEIGQDVKMLQAGSSVVGDTVRLRAGSQVYNVHFNEEFFGPDATILGNQVTPQSLPVLMSLPAFPSITPGATDVVVLANQTLTLAAGSYRNITVNHDATLILTGGVYHLERLDVRQDAKLHFTAPAEMRVKNEMDTDANAFIGPAPSAPSLMASQIVFYVEGADDGGDLASTVVQIGQRNTVRANFFAPNGTVFLRANTVATGAFIGKRAQIGERVELTLKSAF